MVQYLFRVIKEVDGPYAVTYLHGFVNYVVDALEKKSLNCQYLIVVLSSRLLDTVGG